MKRLTVPRNGVRELTLLTNMACVDDSCNFICDSVEGDCLKCPINKALDRLSDYEDTGLTPEEIEELKYRIESLEK